MPDRLSLQVNVTVTGVLFQPLLLGGGEADAVITGGVRSMLTFTVVEALFPATSITVPVTGWFAP